MQTICEHCNAKKEHLYLMTLPCGYVVCHDHLKSLHETGSRNYYANSRGGCFMCKNSSCIIEIYSNMAKNKSKLSEITFLDQLSMVKSKINTIEKCADNYLDNYLDPIVKKINLKREQIKNEIIKKIDESYFKLMDEVKEIRANFKETIGTIRLGKKKLEMIENCENKNLNEITKHFNDKLKQLRKFETYSIDPTYTKIDTLKSIYFEFTNYPQDDDQIRTRSMSRKIGIIKQNKQNISYEIRWKSSRTSDNYHSNSDNNFINIVNSSKFNIGSIKFKNKPNKNVFRFKNKNNKNTRI